MEGPLRKLRDVLTHSVQTPGLRPLLSAIDLEATISESHDHPVLLFKHSGACPFSHGALEQVVWFLQVHRAPASYVVTVQTHADLCDAIARRLGVRHETPQAILVDKGLAVWYRSHSEITADSLHTAARDARFIQDDPRPPGHEDDPEDDDDEAPETPLDEPPPKPIQDPPPEPDKGPYTVHP